jgi:hypothetical protein
LKFAMPKPRPGTCRANLLNRTRNNLPPFCKLFNCVLHETDQTFSEATRASKNRLDLKIARISLKISRRLSCRTSLLRFRIPVTCEGTWLGEFRPRHQRDFLELDREILCNDRTAHQTVFLENASIRDGWKRRVAQVERPNGLGDETEREMRSGRQS